MHAGYWPIGKWKNIPVFFHWTLFLWLPWYFLINKNLIGAVFTFLAFVALLVAHEIGHAYIAKLRRVRVDAIKLYLLHGQCEHEQPYYEIDDVFIAWGGVLAQLVILILTLAVKYSLLLMPLTYFSFRVFYFLAPVFFVFINANIVIAAINLIPIAPLDGHKAWRAIPLLLDRLSPSYKTNFYKLRKMLNLKKRRAAKVESARVVSNLLDRLRNK
jgi:Zn-dependent protease